MEKLSIEQVYTIAEASAMIQSVDSMLTETGAAVARALDTIDDAAINSPSSAALRRAAIAARRAQSGDLAIVQIRGAYREIENNAYEHYCDAASATEECVRAIHHMLVHKILLAFVGLEGPGSTSAINARKCAGLLQNLNTASNRIKSSAEEFYSRMDNIIRLASSVPDDMSEIILGASNKRQLLSSAVEISDSARESYVHLARAKAFQDETSALLEKIKDKLEEALPAIMRIAERDDNSEQTQSSL